MGEKGPEREKSSTAAAVPSVGRVQSHLQPRALGSNMHCFAFTAFVAAKKSFFDEQGMQVRFNRSGLHELKAVSLDGGADGNWPRGGHSHQQGR